MPLPSDCCRSRTQEAKSAACALWRLGERQPARFSVPCKRIPQYHASGSITLRLGRGPSRRRRSPNRDRAAMALHALQNQRRPEQQVTVTFTDRPPDAVAPGSSPCTLDTHRSVIENRSASIG